MTGGEIWAARVASIAGMLLWGFGALLHVQFFVVPLVLLDALVTGDAYHHRGLGWVQGLMMAGWVLAGPIVVAAGGGLRFLAGTITGVIVTGRLASRIVLFAWLRYECAAAAIGAGLMAFFFPLGSYEWSPVMPLSIFVGGIVLAIALFYGAAICNRRKNDLMWKVREERVGSGMVPYPKGAVPRRRDVPPG